ncbi:MAG: hypothetical protein ACRC6T_02730 [Sarcina sp.]
MNLIKIKRVFIIKIAMLIMYNYSYRSWKLRNDNWKNKLRFEEV